MAERERKDSMAEWRERLQKEQQKLECLLKKLAEQENPKLNGTLRISSNRGYPRYYHCKGDDTHGKYIPRKNLETARQLAQKEYEEKIRKNIEKRLWRIDQLLRMDDACEDFDEIYDGMHEARKQLVVPIQPTWEEQLKHWEDEVCQGKGFSTDSIAIYTEKGEQVRSKSEKILADYFYHQGIPYKYEKPLVLNGFGTVYPDFTILSPKIREEIYWEHHGMMDDPGYAKGAIRKIETYQRNGIYLGERLIVTFETSDMPLNTKTMHELAQRYLI